MAATAGSAGSATRWTLSLQTLAFCYVSSKPEADLSRLPDNVWRALVAYVGRCSGINLDAIVTVENRNNALKKLEALSLARIKYLSRFFNQVPASLQHIQENLSQQPLMAFDPIQTKSVIRELDYAKKSILLKAIGQNQRDLVEISYDLVREEDDFVVAQAAAFLGDVETLGRFFSTEQSETSWSECLKMALKGKRQEIVEYLLAQHDYNLESLKNALTFAIAENLFEKIMPVWSAFLGKAEAAPDNSNMAQAMLELLQISMQSGNGELVSSILSWDGWNEDDEVQIQRIIIKRLSDALSRVKDEYCVCLIERLNIHHLVFGDNMTPAFKNAVKTDKTQSVQALLNRFYGDIDKKELLECYLQKPSCVAVQTIIGVTLKMHAEDRDLTEAFEGRRLQHNHEEFNEAIKVAMTANDAERARTLFAVSTKDCQQKCLNELLDGFVYNNPAFLTLFQEFWRSQKQGLPITQFVTCSALAKAILAGDMVFFEWFEKEYNLLTFTWLTLLVVIKAAIVAKNADIAKRYFGFIKDDASKAKAVCRLLTNVQFYIKDSLQVLSCEWNKDVDYQNSEAFQIVKDLFDKVPSEQYKDLYKETVWQTALTNEYTPVCAFLREKGWKESSVNVPRLRNLFCYYVFNEHNDCAQRIFQAAKTQQVTKSLPLGIKFLWLHNYSDAENVLPKTTLNKFLNFVAKSWLGDFLAEIIHWFYEGIQKTQEFDGMLVF